MNLPIVLIAMCFIGWSSAQICPYTRFSIHHYACSPINPNCRFLRAGVSYEEAESILDEHNLLRSQVAMGWETRAGGMPPASNMMQMEWDHELARIAQRKAENCAEKGDCRECRLVENFPVGQNVEYRITPCPGFNCPREKSDWRQVIQSFYNSIENKYNSSYVGSYQGTLDQTTTLTQLIWGNTWRVGCGYASMLSNQQQEIHKYVCEYGPEGNLKTAPLYKQGELCSDCPINSCCGGYNCEAGLKTYPGLCKMTSPDTFPVYPGKYKQDGLIFYCDFDSENQDCVEDITGEEKWSVKKTLSGNLKTIQLNGGQSSELHLIEPIIPDGNFCIQFRMRQGPTQPGMKSKALVNIVLDIEGVSKEIFQFLYSGHYFIPISIDRPEYSYAYVSIEYKVPADTPQSILEIKDIVVFNGNCTERDIKVLGYQ